MHIAIDFIPHLTYLMQRLSEMVFGLKAFGVTALGPALLSAIVLASDRAGSRVILCTDGLANRGIGSFQHQATEAAIAATEQFYLYLAGILKVILVFLN